MDTPEAVISALGIVGTLAGVLFGYRGALRSVELQHEHEDRTRFQEHRLQAFADYLEAVNSVMATRKFPHPLLADMSAMLTASFAKLNLSYKMIDLCGGPDVVTACHAVHAAITPYVQNAAQVAQGTPPAVLTTIIQLERAMRTELGVDGLTKH